MNNRPSLSVVIPVFNEGKTVRNVIENLQGQLPYLPLQSWEIIAINDGSHDDSGQVLDSLPDIRVIHHKVNRGYSASLKTGIRNSIHDWILTIDSDGAHSPTEITKLLACVPKYDLVVGSRNHKDAHDTFWRKTGRFIVTGFAQYICRAKIEDVNSGFRIFHKDLAKKFWHLFPERFSFSTTLTVAAHIDRAAVTYIPVRVRERQAGVSGIKPAKDFLGFLGLVGRLAIYFRPLRVFVPLSVALFLTAWIIVVSDYFWKGGVLDTTFAILIMSSIQALTFGVIAEMIVKRFYASNGQ